MSYSIKRGDLWPPIPATLRDKNGPIPLAGAQVRFLMKQTDGVKVVNQLATIVAAAAGEVKYTWQAGDTAEAGIYRVEWEITFAFGTPQQFGPQTVPNEGYNEVRIWEDVA